MAIKTTLNDLIKSLSKDIQKVLAENIRESDLDKRPHVLDISKESLSSNGKEFTNELYNLFIVILKSYVPIQVKNIDEYSRNIDKKGNKTIITTLIEDPPLLIGPSYGTIQSLISKVSKDPKLVNTVYGRRKYTSEKGKEIEVTNLDIGHIASNRYDEAGAFFVSPAQQRIASLLDTISTQNSSNIRVIDKLNQHLEEINNIQANISYEIRKMSADSLLSLEGKLGSMFVAVSLQTSEKNQKVYNPIEANILNKVRFDVATLLGKPQYVKWFLEHNASNSILEDIQERIASAFIGKSNLVPHTTKNKQVNTSVKKKKIQLVNTKLPTLRTLQNRNYSLTSLQALINSSLQHVISANMGDGAERKILNYRTGRFAASAKVEKMSQSREGMITAFYTYMKNPYQTFEPGFAQGHPASRDPKLLISKSIREIAATKVGNRLRAVLV